jgi:hypothetical protein
MIEWLQWRRRPACARDRAAEETSGVESMRRGLREFWVEKRNDTGRTTIYRLETISSGS